MARSDILVYALHYEGEFNKNSLGAVSEGARLASELGGECHVLVLGGDDLTDELCASLGNYGASKVYRVEGPEGLSQPVVDAMAAAIEAGRVGYDNARAHCTAFNAPPAKAAGQIIEDEDTNETVEKIVAWLDERKLLA